MAISGGTIILASDVSLFRGVQTGTSSISFTTQVSNSTAVTFPVAFAAAPMVVVNIDSGAGSTSGWNARAINITTTGFTIFSFGPSVTWAAVPVSWLATTR